MILELWWWLLRPRPSVVHRSLVGVLALMLVLLAWALFGVAWVVCDASGRAGLLVLVAIAAYGRRWLPGGDDDDS